MLGLQSDDRAVAIGERSLELLPGATVIVPAFNEALNIADTLRSLKDQTRPPDEIIVVDDCSDDGTGDIARALDVTVVRPPRNTGSKAAAQTFALDHVNTSQTITVDADTILAPDALEKILSPFSDPEVAAACGFVVPRHVRSVWERGRYIEYLVAFTFFKPIQNYYGKPLISSGCFSAYRTSALLAAGGWSDRTLAEDMDLTWTLYESDWKVRFVPEAVCMPIEPASLTYLHRQLRRWSHGFVQNVRLHQRKLPRIGFLRSMLAVAQWDAVIAPLVYLFVIPALSLFLTPWFLIGYVIDAPVVAIPVIVGAVRRHEKALALCSLPAFFLLRIVNGLHMLQAVWSEWIRGVELDVYEKGH